MTEIKIRIYCIDCGVYEDDNRYINHADDCHILQQISKTIDDLVKKHGRPRRMQMPDGSIIDLATVTLGPDGDVR